jgi:hypothetical protein
MRKFHRWPIIGLGLTLAILGPGVPAFSWGAEGTDGPALRL